MITLIAVGDEEAMTSLSPGRPVTWQVGVTSDPPDPGQIDLTVQTSGPLAEEATGLQLRVDSCPSRWVAGSCGPGPAAVLAEGPAARFARAAMPAGRLRAGDERWLQVTAWLATAGQHTAPGRSPSPRPASATGWTPGRATCRRPGRRRRAGC